MEQHECENEEYESHRGRKIEDEPEVAGRRGSSRRYSAMTVTTIFCGRSGLLVLMTSYAFLGAVLFRALEAGGYDNGELPSHVQRNREECLRELWLITERLNVLYEKNWTKLVTEQLKRFERAVVESGRNGDTIAHPAGSHWTFGGALLYTITLLTTVGYSRLSPRTALGKVLAVVYALIGVPLMLVLLSSLGSMFATGVRNVYGKMSCQGDSKKKNNRSPSVGYYKAPTSPSNRSYCKNYEDSASIQLASSTHTTPNHICTKPIIYQQHNHLEQQQHGECPKRTLLATVRASHARGRCRQGQVRQFLADPLPPCPSHSGAVHGNHCRSSIMIGGGAGASDIDDAEDGDDGEPIACTRHDTPSRMPLIWHPPDQPRHSPHHRTTSLSSPSVPPTLVLLLFVSYVCAGAAAFASAAGWTFLDAAYFCFIALSTIGVGDRLESSGGATTGQEWGVQVQLLACCLYLFVGLVVVAMCFTLVQEEVAVKCRHLASHVGLAKH